jgi:hypothetical protein
MYSPLTGTFISRDSWQGDYNRPLSLNRWNYTEGNPVNYIDPSGFFSMYEIMKGFGASTPDEVINRFKSGGTLAGKWGYLAFLSHVDFSMKYNRVWKEIGRDYGILNADLGPMNSNLIFRPNLNGRPCDEISPWTANACYSESEILAAGGFQDSNYPARTPIWVDINTGARLSLLQLGLLDADWYSPSYDRGDYHSSAFYAYEKYPIIVGYQNNDINWLSLSSNVAGVLGPCALLTCPEGGPICTGGAIMTLYSFLGGTITFTADLDKLEIGEADLIDVAIDGCSAIPGVGIVCNIVGAASELKGEPILLEYP